MNPHAVSAQADMSAVNVKPQRGGRSQNYMPPAAEHAVQEDHKARQQLS